MATEEIVIRAVDQFSATAKQIEGTTKSLSAAFSAMAGAAALGGVTLAVKKCVEAYAEQEKVQTQLAFSLRAVGVTAKSVMTNYLEFSKSLQANSMFQEEQIVQVETLFTQYGLYGDQLKRATKASIDFATATGIDLQSAAMLFAKASEGSTGALSRYGLKVDEAKLRTQGFNYILDLTEQKFKDFGAAAMETTAGRMKKFGDAWDDLTKSVGGLFSALEGKLNVLGTLGQVFKKIAEPIENSLTPIGRLKNELQKLNTEKEFLEKNIQFGWEAGLKDENIRKLELVKIKIEDINKSMRLLDEIPDADKKKPKPPDPAAMAEWQKFYDELVVRTSTAFDSIDAERQKDLNRVKKFLDEGKVSYKQAKEAEVKIEEAASRKKLELISSIVSQTSDAVSNAIKGDISGMISGLQSVVSSISPVLGSITSLGISIGKTFSGIMSSINSSVEASTKSMIDGIERINSEVDKAFKRLKEYQDEAAKIKAGKVAEFVGFGNYDINPNDPEGNERKAQSILEQLGLGSWDLAPGKKYQSQRLFARMRVEKDDSGNIVFISTDLGGREMGFYDSKTGKIHVESLAYDLPEEFIGRGLRGIYNLYMSGKLSAPADNSRGYARGGLVGGLGSADDVPAYLTPGEFVVSRRGVNSQTIGLLKRLNEGQSPSGNNIVINVSAIDEHGVAKFLKDKMAPMMKELSGRGGVVFLNTRGVSANA